MVALALATTACAERAPQRPTPASQAPATVAAPAAQPAQAASPVLLFVASAAIGETVTLNDPYFGGPVFARLDSEYTAASGRLCRRFSIGQGGRPDPGQVFYACQTDGVWALSGIY